jgi:hypothetical protein
MVIDPVDIQELLDKEPFERFRIHMSDGKSYDVVNPDLAVAMESNFFLALPKGRWKLLSYINMTSIEDARRTRTKRNGRRAS